MGSPSQVLEISKYNDVFRTTGAGDVTYVRKYEKEDGEIVVRNHHIDHRAKVCEVEFLFFPQLFYDRLGLLVVVDQTLSTLSFHKNKI